MARFHMHMSVSDLAESIRFYSILFGSAPDVVKDDYAKWELDDPKVNFAVSTRGRRPGLDHVGIQAESDAALADLRGRLDAAGLPGVAQPNTTCCYARSDKYWTVDPQGIPWETFHSLDTVPTFGAQSGSADGGSACCVPSLPGAH